MLTNKRFRRFISELNQITEAYRNVCIKKKIDWATYEREYRDRIRYVARELNNIADEAASVIVETKPSRGRPSTLRPSQKAVSLLIKSIVMQSNRKMSNLMSLFGALTGINVSYKVVERLYSEDKTEMVLHNMFVLTIKKKNLKDVDVTGDGTGYSLTITKHYRSEGSKEGSRNFTYSFKLMDLKTGLYICYGSSVRSEKDAYNKAVEMLAEIKRSCGIRVRSERLDKYYSYQSTLQTVDEKTVLYILPRKDTKMHGPSRWRRIFRNMMMNPINYLKEYYRRENSESGFSADKRAFGWKIWQKRDDRIDTAMTCISVLHNLFRMGYG